MGRGAAAYCPLEVVQTSPFHHLRAGCSWDLAVCYGLGEVLSQAFLCRPPGSYVALGVELSRCGLARSWGPMCRSGLAAEVGCGARWPPSSGVAAIKCDKEMLFSLEKARFSLDCGGEKVTEHNSGSQPRPLL